LLEPPTPNPVALLRRVSPESNPGDKQPCTELEVVSAYVLVLCDRYVGHGAIACNREAELRYNALAWPPHHRRAISPGCASRHRNNRLTPLLPLGTTFCGGSWPTPPRVWNVLERNRWLEGL